MLISPKNNTTYKNLLGADLHHAEQGLGDILRGSPLVLEAPEHADLVLQSVQLPRDAPDPGNMDYVITIGLLNYSGNIEFISKVTFYPPASISDGSFQGQELFRFITKMFGCK